MATFVFTAPATDMLTGERGTLVLTSERASKPGDDPRGALILVDHPDNLKDTTPSRRRGVPLDDVESLEITTGTSGNPGADTFQQTSIVTLRLKKGSPVVYGLARSNPALVRAVFAEAGWTRRHRSRARVDALADAI